MIQTKIINNFRRIVENFDSKIFRSKESKIELKLYFELNFVMLSRFCFIHVIASIPTYFLKFQKLPKKHQKSTFCVGETLFSEARI